MDVKTSEIEKWVWFYHKEGFSVIPLGKNKGFWNNNKDEPKKPSLRGWDKYKTTRATKEEIQQWIDDDLFKNIGIICGRVSNDLVIIDIDDETIPEILGLKFDKIIESGAWPSKTGKGYQIWMKHHSNPGGIKRPIKHKIEYRANNGYCVAPPSTHPNGKNYHFIGVKDFKELPELENKDVKSIFAEFKKQIGVKWDIKEKKYIPTTKTKETKDYPECVCISLETITKPPMRYYTMYGLASSFAMQKIPRDMAMRKIKEFNLKKCVPPHDNNVVENLVIGAYKPEAHHYGCEFWRDVAGACPYEEEVECPWGKKKAKRELLKEYKVLTYKEKKNNETGEIYFVVNGINSPRLAKLLMNGEGETYLTIKDNQEIYRYNGKIYEKTIKSFIEGRINYYLDDLTTKHIKDETISYMEGENLIDREEMDGNPNLLPLENGVLDIEKKKLLDYTPEYQFTHYLPIKYDPKAKIDKIKTFFEEIIPLNYIPIIQQFFGDCLLPDYRYKKAMLCAGPRHTGKTTFLNLIGSFLGEKNISHNSLYSLCAEKYSTADLYQKRANICAQVEAANIVKVNLFLMLTGNDSINARRIYEAPFNFTNFAKLIFACNDIPTTKVTGKLAEAYYIRWIILPFENIFDGDEKDVNMLNKLITDEKEMSGLLNFALGGIKLLEKNNGYCETMDYDEIKDFMEKGTNPIREFVDTYITRSSGREWIGDVYKSYVCFCKDQDYPFVNDVWFSRKVFPLLPMSATTGHGGKRRFWDGITCSFAKETKQEEL